MTLHHHQPVANGLRTDHPIPDVPFVDDGHIPVEDPQAVQAVGRNKGHGTWGREDPARDGGWVAFTTDPLRHDLGWLVRWHPDHGRSVTLYRQADITDAYTAFRESGLLARSGGYWWDGAVWYRPAQVWDRASERYVRRPVPAATSVSAADLLTRKADPSRAEVLQVTDVDPDKSRVEGSWLDHLALWAQRYPDLTALDRCVVKLSAPELAGEELVDTTGLAQVAGIAASTLRAYMARGEGNLPAPQALVSGRAMWSRPVAEEWAEQRRRDPAGVEEAVSMIADSDWDGAGGSTGHAAGISALWDRYTNAFTWQLWRDPGVRKRWALRWRNQPAVEEVARGLAWTVAADLPNIAPISDIAVTVEYAILGDLASSQKRDRSLGSGAENHSYGLFPQIAKTLDWLIRHDPNTAADILGHLVGQAKDDLGLPSAVIERTIDDALSLDGQLNPDARRDFLARVFTPAE